MHEGSSVLYPNTPRINQWTWKIHPLWNSSIRIDNVIDRFWNLIAYIMIELKGKLVSFMDNYWQ